MFRPFIAPAVAAVATLTASPASAVVSTFEMDSFSVNLTDALLGPKNQFYGDEHSLAWNLEANFGGFALGSGFRVGGKTRGTASLYLGYSFQDMKTSLDWDGRSTVTIENSGDSSTYRISSNLTRQAGSTLSTHGLKYTADAKFALDASATFHGKGCISGFCSSGETKQTLDAALSLLRLGNAGSGPFQLLNAVRAPKFDDPYVFTAGACPSGIPGCTIGQAVASITGFNPSFSASSQSGTGNGLSLSQQAHTVTAALDLDFLLTSITLLPQPSLRAEFGPIDAEIDLYNFEADLSLDLKPQQRFSPGERHTYQFDRDVLVLQTIRRATFQPSRVLASSGSFNITCSLAQAQNPTRFPSTHQAAQFGERVPTLAIEADTVASRCYDLATTKRYVDVKAGEPVTLDSADALTVYSPDPFNVTVATQLAPVVETVIDLSVVGEFVFEILEAEADFDIYKEEFGPLYDTSFPVFDAPIPLYRGRDYLERQTCGQQFAINGSSISVVDDSFFCGRAAPGISQEEIPIAANDPPVIPELTLIGGPFEVPEPAGTLPLMALLAAAIAWLRQPQKGRRERPLSAPSAAARQA